MTTTRKDFGNALAVLARLYRAAETRGDEARARRYAVAVDLVLGAWPSDGSPSPEARGGPGGWPATESTLIGLGSVQ